jgi:DNA-directed RNA polymerase specialized sigma24 family protein
MNAVLEVEVDAPECPTTKQTLHDLTESPEAAPRSTGEDLERVLDVVVTAKRHGLFADDYIAPRGSALIRRNGHTVLVPVHAVTNTDRVINTKRIQLSPVGRLPDVHINLTNRLFLRGEVKPDVFIDQLSAYLSHWVGGNKEVTNEFLSLETVVNRMGNGKFATKTLFAKTLRTEFIDFAQEFYPSYVVEVTETDPLAALLKAQTQREITQGYLSLISGDPFGQTRFYLACYRLIQKKCAWRVSDLREVSATPSDYAQKAVIRIWKSLPQFRGGPAAIYAWVNKVAYNASLDCFRETKEYIDRHVPLFTPEKDENGVENPEKLEENPLIIQRYIHGEHSGLEDLDSRELPTNAEGIDRLIVNQHKAGLTWAEIAKGLGLPPATVRKKVERMRKRARWETKPLEA